MGLVSMLMVLLRFLVSAGFRSAVVPMLTAFARSYGVAVLQVAFDTVREVAESAGEATGAQKRQKALKKARAELLAKGIEVADNVLNAAIEMGVASLKKGK